MARETVFYSKDPDVKPGLVEEIRNMALARSQAGSVGDIAAVMKEAVLWTTRGREVTEENLQAMLEGREDLSEVQENPFAEMMKEDEAAEAAMSGAPASTPTESPTVDAAAPVENVPPTTETVSPVEETASADKVISSQPEPPAETEKPAAPATSQMSDEEFEAFMKKAQAFYDTQAEETTSSENIDEDSDDDDDDFPSLEVHSGDD
jgi:hypothetical protein